MTVLELQRLRRARRYQDSDCVSCGREPRGEGVLCETCREKNKAPGGAYMANKKALSPLDGRKFRGKASMIVASPPCTEFSYMAMPWTRAKRIARAFRGLDDFPDGYKGSRTVAELTALFDACVRIGREAECPIVIENVRGAQPWIGKARANYGSFYLWGDVPALMPTPLHEARDGTKQAGLGGVRANGMGNAWFQDGAARHGSKSSARKAASARIAMIPERLARWVAAYYYPAQETE